MIFFNLMKKYKKFILVFSVVIMCLNLYIKDVEAIENKVIKVGYPIVEGFTELNDGVYSGYAFEYLMEISKYTGWQYEFIEMGLNESLNKLKSGEIDIVAGMIKNEKTTEIFDFPESNSGYTYSILATLKSNTHISITDYNTLNGIKIGYFDRSVSKVDKLNDFFENNNIKDTTFISYPSSDSNALINALNNKEIDAIITGDLLLNNGLKVLTKYDSYPYYFSTTKGNTEIIEGLDKAIRLINRYTPAFVTNLYSKYFENKKDNSFILTEEEQEYLSKLNTLKAIYVDDFKPVQYYDKSTKEAKGFIVDIGKRISEKLGVSLELIKADNYDEARKLIQENHDYIALGIPVDYDTYKINNILFTKSYLDLDIVKVYSKKAPSNKEDQILAVPNGYGYNDMNIGYKIKYYDTIEDCLFAVEKNEASLTYGNYYTISSYISNSYFSNLSVVPDSHSVPASCAVSTGIDEILFNIINKAILSLSDEDIKTIIYNNATEFKASISLKGFFLSNLTLSLTIISIILIIIALLIAIIIKMKFKALKNKKNMLLLKSQRDQLTELYNRSTCEDLISSYFKEFNGLYYSFIIIDIDHFKEINDTFGHMIGDQILQEFSELLKKSFSSDDIICRLGGDEFVIFIKNIYNHGLNDMDIKLHDLCKSMNKDITYNGKTLKISISAGAIIDNKYATFSELYKKSDELLYDVKRTGRNGFKMKEDF